VGWLLLGPGPWIVTGVKWPVSYSDDPFAQVAHRENVPVTFDCSMRKLAYRFGQRLQPWQGTFDTLFEALGLIEECNGSLVVPNVSEPLPGYNNGTRATRSSIAESPEALFVDPLRGYDAGLGHREAPLRTIQEALDRVAGRNDSVIVLREGSHYLGETLQIGPRHSGLTLIAFPGERPIVSGGKRLNVTWRQASGPRGVRAYVANITGQVDDVPSLQVDGKRYTRARFPNLPGGLEVSPHYGSMIKASYARWTPPNFARFGPPTYFTDFNHTRDTTADGWYQHYQIGIGGQCSVYDPPVSYWCSQNVRGGSASPFCTPAGVTVPGALPNAPYANASQAMLFVWHPKRWENWMFEVEAYDPVHNGFAFGRGGNQGARGSPTGGDFFVENVWEELDHPGEFFYDRETGELYIIFNDTDTTDPTESEFVVPQLQVLVNATGSQWNPVVNFTMYGITFMASAPTFMMPHGVPSAGDWALERMGAIFLEGTVGVKLENCTLERLDGHGVMVSGFNRNATISFSEFAYLGGSGIASWGYTNETSGDGHPAAGVDGTDGNHPRYTTVLYNLIREVGLYEKQNSFFVQAKTAQSRLVGNIFFNGPRAGINFNDGFGGGDEIAHNLVFSTCRESGDHGPLNSWDRQPFLTTVRTGEPSLVMAVREIHHNFFIDNYSPQEAVDNDDGSNYYHTHHNFLVYGSYGLKSDYGGHDNHHDHNIYAFLGIQAMILNHNLPGHETQFDQNRVIFARPGGWVRAYGGNLEGLPCSAHNYQDGGPVTGDATAMRGNDFYTLDGAMWLCPGVPANPARLHTIPADDVILGWAIELLDIHGHGEPHWPEPHLREVRRQWGLPELPVKLPGKPEVEALQQQVERSGRSSVAMGAAAVAAAVALLVALVASSAACSRRPGLKALEADEEEEIEQVARGPLRVSQDSEASQTLLKEETC
jgi:hypothetical protein